MLETLKKILGDYSAIDVKTQFLLEIRLKCNGFNINSTVIT